MTDESRPDVQRALERHRAAPQSRAFAPLAAAYRASGDTAAAVRVLEDGLVHHARYVAGLVLLGECQRELGDEESAEATFARVLDLDPDNLVALRYRAQRAHRRGALDRAVDALRRAMEIDPFDRDVQADLGLVTAALDRQARERSVGARVVEAEPVLPAPSAPAAAVEPLVEPFVEPFVEPAWEAPPRPAAVLPAAPDWDAESTQPPAAAEWGTESPPTPEWIVETPPAFAPAPEPAIAPLPPPPPAAEVPPAPEWAPPWIEPRPTAGRPARETVVPPRPASAPPPFEWREPPAAWPPAAAAEAEPTIIPPTIDLRRVGQPPEPAAAPAAAAETPPPPGEAPPWGFTRQDDRIVVSPTDAPVRGPIRSVEDRLFAEQRGFPLAPDDVAAESQPESTPEPVAAPPVAAGGQFATLTLAGIYESQGYLHKALAIYDALHRAHPNDPTIATRLTQLQRRLAGAEVPRPEPPPRPAPPPIAPADVPSPPPASAAAAEESVAWRLVDATTLGPPQESATRLRAATAAVRSSESSRQHTLRGAPEAMPPQPPAAPGTPEPPPPPPAEPGGGHEDYERFLRYLRSLKP